MIALSQSANLAFFKLQFYLARYDSPLPLTSFSLLSLSSVKPCFRLTRLPEENRKVGSLGLHDRFAVGVGLELERHLLIELEKLPEPLPHGLHLRRTPQQK